MLDIEKNKQNKQKQLVFFLTINSNVE